MQIKTIDKTDHESSVYNRKRTHQIASMNVDTLRTNASIYNTIGGLSRNKIDISRIQETHNDRTDSVEINDYEIIFGGSGKSTNENNNISYPGEAAIAIHQSLTNRIQKIIRINGRIMEIRLQTGLKNLIYYQY